MANSVLKQHAKPRCARDSRAFRLTVDSAGGEIKLMMLRVEIDLHDESSVITSLPAPSHTLRTTASSFALASQELFLTMA